MNTVVLKLSLMLLVLPAGCDWMKSKLLLDSKESFDVAQDVIVAMTKSFPLELFLDDVQSVLMQVVDRGGRLVEYKRNGTLHDEVVYRGGLQNENSTVVVLHKSEDKLPVFNDKRVFVVLRQDPMLKKVVSYFGNYVYARLGTNSHVICNESYNLEHVCIEWDTWEENRVLEKAPYKYLGWGDCSRTFFSSCHQLPLENNCTNNRKAGGGNVALYPKFLKGNHPSVAENLSFVTPSSFLTVLGGENDSTYDLMWDLDNDKVEAYHVRELIKNFSIIADPSSTLHHKKDGKLKGFNSEITPDASLLTLIQLAKDNYLARHEGKNVTHNESTYETLKGNLHKHAELIKKIHETRVQLRDLLRLIGKNDYLTIRKNPVEMEMMNNNPDFRNLEERLEGLEKELELIDQQDSDMEQNLQNLDDSVSINISLSDILSKPGWKYQEFADNQNVPDKLAWKDGLLFYGFGTCEYEKAEWNIQPSVYDDEPTNEDLEKMADFYLKLLRLHCLPEVKHYLFYLIDAGFLRRNANFFVIPEDLSVLQKPKLAINELRMISAALEFSIFTKTYDMLLKMEGIPQRRRTTDIPLIYIPNASRTLDFILHFTTLFVKHARADVDVHFIKMCRNLVITLRGIMARLIQDYEILQVHCKNGLTLLICEEELKANYGNKLVVNIALQWVLHGLAPIELNRNVNTEKNLKAFYKANKKSIELSLEYYYDLE